MASTWKGWLGSVVGNKWMTYDDGNFPMRFTYASSCSAPCCSFALPIDEKHPLIEKLHADLSPRSHNGNHWLVCHLMKCSGTTIRIGKEDELEGDDQGTRTVKDYWLMQCFIPVDHTSTKLPWPTPGVSYAGIFYEPAITRDSANALLYRDRVPFLEHGLEVSVQEGMHGATYTVKTPSGIDLEISMEFNPLDVDVAKVSSETPGSQTDEVDGASFFLTYRNVYYCKDDKLYVGAMGETTNGAVAVTCTSMSGNLVSYLSGAACGADTTSGSSLKCHVFTAKLLRTQIVADWYSQALAEDRYVPRALQGTGGQMRASLELCQPGEEMTALEKHVLFFCGSPEDAPHISTATLSFETIIDRVSLLRGFEDGKTATALGYVVLGSFGLKARNSCPMMRKLGGTAEGWSIPNIGMEGVARLGLHGSDSGIYDQHGQFDENAFQQMLRITGADKTGVITEEGILSMQALQYTSWFSHQQATGEMSALMAVLFDGAAPHRTIPVDRMRRFYEGELLYESAGETAPWI